MKTTISIALGLLLLAAIIYMYDPSKVLEALGRSDVFLLFLSTIFLIVMHIIMAFRVKYIGSLLNERITFKEGFNAHMLGMLLSEFTPGRSAYFLSSAYLKKKGLDSAKALTALVSAQPFDFFAKFLGASLGFFLLTKLNPIFLLIPFVLSIAFFLVVFSRRVARGVDKIAEKSVYKISIIQGYAKKFMDYIKRMSSHSKIVAKKWHIIVGFVALSYTARILNWFLLFYSLRALTGNYLDDFVLFYLIQPLINIVEFLPLPTPAGSGFSESASIIVLERFGVSSVDALAFALLARIQSIVVSFIFGYLPMKETIEFLKKRLFS